MLTNDVTEQPKTPFHFGSQISLLLLWN